MNPLKSVCITHVVNCFSCNSYKGRPRNQFSEISTFLCFIPYFFLIFSPFTCSAYVYFEPPFPEDSDEEEEGEGEGEGPAGGLLSVRRGPAASQDGATASLSPLAFSLTVERAQLSLIADVENVHTFYMYHYIYVPSLHLHVSPVYSKAFELRAFTVYCTT